jgi:hypothetical protein
MFLAVSRSTGDAHRPRNTAESRFTAESDGFRGSNPRGGAFYYAE